MRYGWRISDFRLYNQLTGLWFFVADPNPLKRVLQIVRMLCMFVLTFFYVLSAERVGWRVFMSRVYSGVTIGCSYFVVQWFLVFVNAARIEDFADTPERLLASNEAPENSSLVQSSMESAWKFVRLIWIYIMTAKFIGLDLPVLYDSFVWLTGLGKMLNIAIALEGVLPDDFGVLYWILKYLNMILGTVFVFFIIGNISLMILSVCYMRAAIALLCRKIDIWDKTTDAVLEKCLMRDIIAHHVVIIKMNKLLNDFIGLQSFVQHVIGTFTITFFLYAMRKHTGSQFVLCLNNTLGTALILFIYCYSGELLHSEGLRLYDRLIMVDWDKKSVRTRTALAMILIQAQRPLRIRYKSWTLGLVSFGQVMNATYSYFMLLKSLE